jgi:hypothetical protein
MEVFFKDPLHLPSTMKMIINVYFCLEEEGNNSIDLVANLFGTHPGINAEVLRES